jgi:uncharacterized protein (TIGR02145 family)
MKANLLLIIPAIMVSLGASGQQSSIVLTYTAEDNGQHVTLDSILIRNLTSGSDTTLYAPDTVLVLDLVTVTEEGGFNRQKSLSVSHNYPNPFREKTQFDVFLTEQDMLCIIVMDMLGREISNFEQLLPRGGHSFVFYPGSEYSGYYVVKATSFGVQSTILMIHAVGAAHQGSACRIEYQNYKTDQPGLKSQKEISAFGFSPGDLLKSTGYASMLQRTIIDEPTGSKTCTFHYSGNPCPLNPTVSDVDGNIYNTVQIGSQCWMAESLKTGTYKDGSPIDYVAGYDEWFSLTTGAYCYYNHQILMKEAYGAMYNWFAAMDARGLCPTGWHVPSTDDWQALATYIGGTEEPHGCEMKSCRQVSSPFGGSCITSEHPRWNTYDNFWGTNNYNFGALPGGGRTISVAGGNFVFLGVLSGFWTTESMNPQIARAVDFGSEWGEFNMANGYDKKTGSYVRCLKD